MRTKCNQSIVHAMSSTIQPVYWRNAENLQCKFFLFRLKTRVGKWLLHIIVFISFSEDAISMCCKSVYTIFVFLFNVHNVVMSTVVRDPALDSNLKT